MAEKAETCVGVKPTGASMSHKDATLDGLPIELKVLILRFAPKLLALQALVRPSPLFRKVYLDDRKIILSTVLIRDIGTDVLPVALAVHKASQIGFDKPGGRKGSVEAFFCSSKRSEFHRRQPQATLESLSRLQSVVAKITSDFCQTTLSNHPVTGEKMQPRDDLSSNEKRRVYRALYHFELFAILFTTPLGECIAQENTHHFDPMDQSFLFLHILRI